eukprot:6336944-Amphidinium_carterae.1
MNVSMRMNMCNVLATHPARGGSLTTLTGDGRLCLARRLACRQAHKRHGRYVLRAVAPMR